MTIIACFQILYLSKSCLQMYGSALTFYEEFKDISKISEEQKTALRELAKSEDEDETAVALIRRNSSANEELKRLPLQCEKCICLLTRKPLFRAFKEFLMFLYSFCSTPGDRGPVPVERLISFFMYDVLCPSPEKPLIVVDLGCGARKVELMWPSPCSNLPQKLILPQNCFFC